ncbi:MAG: hypothetical protein ACN4G0_17845 [Polyangiales bacterium]
MRTAIAIVLGVLLSACSAPVQLKPASPKSELGWSGVSVTTAEALEGDKKEKLDEYEVLPAMTNALEKSFQTAGGEALRVDITQFRVGWGPTRMHAIAEVVSAEGAVLKKVEADSTTTRKHIKWKRTQRVAQDIVNKLVQGLGADD